MRTLIVDVITLFPQVLEPAFRTGILGRAARRGLVTLRLVDLRGYGEGPHRITDDRPYGGGAGMVMTPGPIAAALESLEPGAHRVLLGPRGARFDQARAWAFSRLEHLVLVSGAYEGVDERVRSLVDEVVSIGDFVLSSGESAAWAVVDATCRLVPGVLEPASLAEESFQGRLLEAPHYTRPRVFRGAAVPDVLVSGDHAAIARWRRAQALRLTLRERPDLWDAAALTPGDAALLQGIGDEDARGALARGSTDSGTESSRRRRGDGGGPRPG